MVDSLTPTHRSENMRRIKSKDMKPEMEVRKLVHSMGYRYRLHRKDLPGKPDLAFISKKKVIFVHGCFWHQHDSKNCRIARKPKSNTAYWNKKLELNKKRDKKNTQLLEENGWESLTIWECQIKDKYTMSKRIQEFLC